MHTQVGSDVILELDRIDELFDAPDTNPFSAREIDILGEAGIDRVRKRVMRVWPRRPEAGRIVLVLPPDQLASDSTEQVRVAIRRYCDAKLGQNWLRRRQELRVGWRQLAIALAILALDVLVLVWLFTTAVNLLPGLLRGVLAMVALLAGSVAIWDAIQSLAFSWGQYLQEDAGYRFVREMDVFVAPRMSDLSNGATAAQSI